MDTGDPAAMPAIFCEICAGSAVLSSHALKAGFVPLPIDTAANRFSPKAKIFERDLTNVNEFNLLQDMCVQLEPDIYHLGLPCGTCSRAREQPIPGVKNPPRQLRDHDHPLGFPDLTASEKLRVNKANEVYRAALSLLLLVYQTAKLIVIENPVRSWLWTILAFMVKRMNNPGPPWGCPVTAAMNMRVGALRNLGLLQPHKRPNIPLNSAQSISSWPQH